ncbi:hypothetical protein Ancab_013181 [Ancistrocladus abbreviatus]
MEKRGHMTSDAEARIMKKFNNNSYYTAGTTTTACTSASASIAAATDNRRDECFPSGQLSWPPRSYTCSFCRREFRSAQALGGHMNVHRRDRARLRHPSPPSSTPSLNLNLSPNHYTNSKSDTSLLPSSSSSSPASSPAALLSEPTKKPGVAGASFQGWSLKVKEGDGLNGSCGYDVEKKADLKVVKLDLEIGVFRDIKEDLDLELRLGYN